MVGTISNIVELFSNMVEIISNIVELFSNVVGIISNIVQLFSNVVGIISNIVQLFSNVTEITSKERRINKSTFYLFHVPYLYLIIKLPKNNFPILLTHFIIIIINCFESHSPMCCKRAFVFSSNFSYDTIIFS